MREYTVEQTSLTFKWVFNRLIPAVPGPGTPGFALLCKSLSPKPYSLEASKVTVDVPTARLSDVTLTLALLDDRAALRITPGFLEMYVHNLFEGDENNLVTIVDASFAALSDIDSDSNQGEAQVRLASHLRLPPLENFALLHEHLKLSDSLSNLIPEAAAYQVDLAGKPNPKQIRVVIAKSLPFEDALFVDFNATYDGPLATADLAIQVESDFRSVIETLGLTEKDERQK